MPTLETMARRDMWPTPSASLGDHAELVTPSKAREGGTLVEAVSARMWPTPAARDGSRGGVRDADAWIARRRERKPDASIGLSLSDRAGGPLNPTWVEWLMGFPDGWTDSEASATPSSRRLPSTSAISSSAADGSTMGRPYADAAGPYWRAGWANPIPVTGKWPPPEGYTGYDGRNVSWTDLQRWTAERGGDNIALRLPGDVIGVDVDAYDGRPGGDSLARAEAELGALPRTVRSTAREPWAASGIRFYRVPLDASLRGAEKRFRARFGDGVDIIRRDHRYAVVWPSVHPATGTRYEWYNDAGFLAANAIPRPTDLPDLPAAWVEFLTGPIGAADVEGTDPTSADFPANHGERPGDTHGVPASVWDTLPRQFTREQAIEFCRPHVEALHSAATGTINNRLNEAAYVLGHFVPHILTATEAHRWLRWALGGTEYDGRTWKAADTIRSAWAAPKWRAELVEAGASSLAPASGDPLGPAQLLRVADDTVTPESRPLRRGDFAGVADRRRVEPAYFHRADGQGLLYPGKDSYLYAETESGKSWLTVLGVSQCIEAGVPVLMVDFEEGDELEVGQRLLALGMTEAKINDPARFRYLMVDGRCALEVLAEAEDMAAQVVIYEGMSVAYDVFGLQVKENDSATAFRRALVKPHLIAGRAVLTTDHVVKDRDNRGRYALGGVMKLNAASGGAYLLVNVEGLAPGQRGASNLFVTKDRPGGVKRASVAAGERFDPQVKRVGTLVVDDTRSFVNYTDVSILAPRPEDAPAAGRSLADEVLAAIGRIRGVGRVPTMKVIRAQVPARASQVDAELERLTTGGQLLEVRGAHGARVFDLPPTSSEENDG